MSCLVTKRHDARLGRPDSIKALEFQERVASHGQDDSSSHLAMTQIIKCSVHLLERLGVDVRPDIPVSGN
jgi:hypothetical protein